MLSEDDRFSIAVGNLQSASRIVEKLRNQDTRDIVTFLKAASCLLCPGLNKEFQKGPPLHASFAGSNEGLLVWTYVFHEDDLSFLPPGCTKPLGLLDAHQRGGYHPQNRILVTNARNEYSSFFRGRLLLHEGFHAWVHQVQSPGKQWDHEEHEYDSECFEYSWLVEYGGEAFEETICLRKKFILRQLEGDKLENYHPKRSPPYPTIIDSFMGSVVNQLEERERNYFIQLYAFHALIVESGASRDEQIRLAALFRKF